MQAGTAALNAAARVLVAVTERRAADPADLKTLREFDGSVEDGRDVDELACDVIKKALKWREEVRKGAR